MNTPTNADRAYWAREALDTFERLTEMQNEELPTIMQDLLTNLMHLADREGINFENVLRMATNNYEAEAEEDE